MKLGKVGEGLEGSHSRCPACRTLPPLWFLLADLHGPAVVLSTTDTQASALLVSPSLAAPTCQGFLSPASPCFPPVYLTVLHVPVPSLPQCPSLFCLLLLWPCLLQLQVPHRRALPRADSGLTPYSSPAVLVGPPWKPRKHCQCSTPQTELVVFPLLSPPLPSGLPS